jgi:hypothetical protein
VLPHSRSRRPVSDPRCHRLHALPGALEHPLEPDGCAVGHLSTALLEKFAHGSGQIPPNQDSVEITISRGASYEKLPIVRLPGWDAQFPEDQPGLWRDATTELAPGEFVLGEALEHRRLHSVESLAGESSLDPRTLRNLLAARGGLGPSGRTFGAE